MTEKLCGHGTPTRRADIPAAGWRVRVIYARLVAAGPLLEIASAWPAHDRPTERRWAASDPTCPGTDNGTRAPTNAECRLPRSHRSAIATMGAIRTPATTDPPDTPPERPRTVMSNRLYISRAIDASALRSTVRRTGRSRVQHTFTRPRALGSPGRSRTGSAITRRTVGATAAAPQRLGTRSGMGDIARMT